MLHGKSYTQDIVFNFLEAIIETYNYETPETILLFLKKAAAGDFGKFYGEPDIGTIREWFATFLGDEIIPARERHQQKEAIGSDDRGQERSLKDYLSGSSKSGDIFIPDRFKGQAGS